MRKDLLDTVLDLLPESVEVLPLRNRKFGASHFRRYGNLNPQTRIYFGRRLLKIIWAREDFKYSPLNQKDFTGDSSVL